MEHLRAVSKLRLLDVNSLEAGALLGIAQYLPDLAFPIVDESGGGQQQELPALADEPLSELRLAAHKDDRRLLRLQLPHSLTVGR